jgi:hypothetical protein
MTFYLDGSSLGTAGAVPQSFNGYWRIGGSILTSWPNISGGSFNGSIDEVGIWSRALTSSEVTSLYNSGSGRQYPFTGSSNQTGDLADFQNGSGSVIATSRLT